MYIRMDILSLFVVFGLTVPSPQYSGLLCFYSLVYSLVLVAASHAYQSCLFLQRDTEATR